MARLEPKASIEVRDYSFDWSAFLAGDTIATSSVVVTGATLTSQANTADSVTVEISGGTSGTVARIVNTITTAGGRVETQTHTLRIADAAEPVSLEEAKAHLRIVDDNSEDALIESYITAARQWVENHTGHILVQRAFTEQRDTFGRYIELHRQPVIGEPTISYIDSDGATQSYLGAVSSVNRYPYRIHPAYSGSWPSVGAYGGVSVAYTAGYAEGEVPQPLIQAMLLLIGAWHSQREAVTVGQVATEVPLAVDALVQQYRIPGI